MTPGSRELPVASFVLFHPAAHRREIGWAVQAERSCRCPPSFRELQAAQVRVDPRAAAWEALPLVDDDRDRPMTEVRLGRTGALAHQPDQLGTLPGATATDARPDRSGGMVLPSLRPVTVIEGGHGRPGVRLHGVQSSAPVQSRAQAHRHRRRRNGCRCAIP